MAARWWPLAVVAAGVSALGAVGVLPRWAGLVHAVALPPLDLAFDLRVLVARAPTYPAFLVGMGVSIVLRTAILGGLLAAIDAGPALGGTVARAVRLYLAALIPLALAAALEFAGLAAAYAWYAWAGLGLTLLAALFLTPRWAAPPGVRLRRVATVVGYVLAVTALGSAADLAGSWAPLFVPVSGLLTGATLVRLTGPSGRRRAARWSRFRRAPAGVAIAALLASPGGIRMSSQPMQPDAVLLVVPGVDSASGLGAAYLLDPEALGFPCQRVFYYSYRGPGEGAPQGEARCPIRVHRPYANGSTQRPLAELVQAFADQVEAIRGEVGDAPLVVVTHSQGAVIAWRAVATGTAPGVTALIGLGGFPHTAVGYPPPHLNGPGRVGADALRILSWVSRFLELGSFDPDAPLARELLATPDGLEAVFAEPLPAGVRAALLFAAGDLVAAPEGHTLPHGETVTIAASHVGIVRSPDATAAIRLILSGRAPGGESPLAALLDPLLPAWLPPPSGR